MKYFSFHLTAKAGYIRSESSTLCYIVPAWALELWPLEACTRGSSAIMPASALPSCFGQLQFDLWLAPLWETMHLNLSSGQLLPTTPCCVRLLLGRVSLPVRKSCLCSSQILLYLVNTCSTDHDSLLAKESHQPAVGDAASVEHHEAMPWSPCCCGMHGKRSPCCWVTKWFLVPASD